MTQFSNDIQDVYKDVEDCNPSRKRNVLVIFYDMIADMIISNKHNQIVTVLLEAEN